MTSLDAEKHLARIANALESMLEIDKERNERGKKLADISISIAEKSEKMMDEASKLNTKLSGM